MFLELVDPVETAVGESIADVGALGGRDLVVLDGGEGVDDVGAKAGVNVLRSELANARSPESK